MRFVSYKADVDTELPIGSGAAPWTFFTNHAHVLLCLAQDPEVRLRDVSSRVGVTERAVQRIISELDDAGYLSRIRVGRRNRYEIKLDLPLRHPIERHRQVSMLVEVIRGATLRPGKSKFD